MWVFERVVIARHGETEWNRKSLREGRRDSPLTEVGLSQSVLLAGVLERLGPDGLFTSPLGRAIRTATVVRTALGLKLQVVPQLTELDHGLFTGIDLEEIDRAHPALLDGRRLSKFRWRFPLGESYEDVAVRAALSLAAVNSHGVRRPVLVCHEMVGRMLVFVLTGMPVERALALTIRNGEALIVDLKPRIVRPLA